jgi:hypothetical protein
MSKDNKKIRNATQCKSGNIVFKSQLEKCFYNTLLEQGFQPQYEPRTYVLWEGSSPITPFYDKETDTQQTKRIENGDTVKNRMLVLKTGKITGIRYTPDFYLKYGKLHVYIEAKGIENDVHYLKKKLFRKYLDDWFLKTGQYSIYFEIYTKKQLLQAIEIIKNYEPTIPEDTGKPAMPAT